MKRRTFIEKSGYGILGIYLTAHFVSCSNAKKVELNSLLGKSCELIPSGCTRIGEKGLVFYILNDSDFSLMDIDVEQAFVYCKKEKITGFMIQIENKGQAASLLDEISTLYEDYSLNYENEFGKEYEWHDATRRIRLSYNNSNNLPRKIFYSETVLNSDLIF